MGTPKDSLQTKQKLIQVAGVMFAERGYTQVTVRDIIDAANANLGALNYHFGTKECLYGAVLEQACEIDRIEEESYAGLPPFESLVLLIDEALTICAQGIEENWPYMLIKRECQFPSHMFDQLVEEHFKYQSAIVAGILSQIVDKPALAPEVELGVATMVGLLDMFGLNGHLITAVLPDLTPFINDRRVMANRVARLVVEAASHEV